MKTLALPLSFAAVLALAGCSSESPETAAESATEAAQTPALPQDFFRTEAPANAVTLSEARASAESGTEIAFTGYIGGRVEPFTEGRAMFVMADSVKSPQCTDACPVPHDACCTPNDVIAANSATVQVVDADGRMLALDLNGQNGLAPGKEVTVLGTVREANDAVFIVDASGIVVADAVQ